MDRVYALVVVIALIAGVGLRVARLGSVPLGFDQDEACSAYDAYSILKTGRDHHGNFLPLALQAFNDYRMALFGYSLIPVIGLFGLKPAVVRLGAAIWGSVDLAAVTLLTGLMLGWPGAAVASVLYALSPWQLPLSRFCHEAITASATVSVAMACFFIWLRQRGDRWLLLSGAFFGLSLYAYSITKVFTPLMIGWLGLFYWRELKEVRSKAAAALGIVALLAVPQGILFLRRTAEMQARVNDIFIFGQAGGPFLTRLENFGAGFISYFTASYLFFTGDRGDHWALLHPPGVGQLLPVQAVLIALALAALAGGRRRKSALLLLAWLIFATVPAALTVPPGALLLQANAPHGVPTAFILISHRESLQRAPFTPSLALAHPNLRRDVLAIAPWTLLSALGFVALLDWVRRWPAAAMGLAGLLLAGATFQGVRFVRSYFRDYPIVAAPYFQYGMAEVMEAVQRLGGAHEPVVITDLINQPYIYVLFYESYPPALFQQGPVVQMQGLWGPVLQFDRYLFVSPQRAYPQLAKGIFVFAGDESTPVPPALSVHYPDGTIAYNIVVK